MLPNWSDLTCHEALTAVGIGASVSVLLNVYFLYRLCCCKCCWLQTLSNCCKARESKADIELARIRGDSLGYDSKKTSRKSDLPTWVLDEYRRDVQTKVI